MFEYKLDLSERSYMRNYTENYSDKNFTPRMTESGYFEAGDEYYTKRDYKGAALLIYTISGAGSFESDRLSATLCPGSALLFHCNQIHSYRTSPSNQSWNFHWAHLDLDSLAGYDELICDKPLMIKAERAERMNEIFLKIDSISERNDSFAAGYRSVFVSELLGIMLSAAEEKVGERFERSADIDRAIEYIGANLSGQISIDQLADQCFISKYHFIRLFKKCTGMSPYKYIMVARINKSKLLLSTTRMPISEIAEAVGFPETSNFSKAFKQLTGNMPSVYRKEHYRW